MTRVDAHHHVWDPARRDYPWMAAPALSPLRRRFDVTDLAPAAAAAGVERTVLVQAVSGEDETRELLAVAASSGGLVAGVVGWVDLTDAGAADALAALLESPGGSALVGVRHQVEDEPAGWLTRADVMAGIAAVGAAGLVYDLLIVPSQLGEAIDVVRRLPHVTFVLDHAAKPDIAGGRWEPWASGLATLASEPNVHAKLSGLHTQASWTGWTVADLRPYADHMVEAFGTGRVIAGSDWPVCELAVDYASAWATVDALLAGATPAECADIVGRNAELTYGLPPQLSR